jgi:Undecaprenyl-phosphate galactose phosphotransferase WbaP
MSTAIMAPERQTLLFNEGKFGGDASRPRFRELVCIFILLLTDSLAFGAALGLAVFLQIQLTRHVLSGESPFPFQAGNFAAIAGPWFLLVTILGADGLYTQRRLFWSEASHLTKAVGVASTAVLVAVALIQPGLASPRAAILFTALNLVLLLPLERYWTKRILGALGLWRKRMLVLGTASTAKLAMQGLTSDPVLGYEIAGLLDDDPAKRGQRAGGPNGEPVFVLGDFSEAREQMQRTQVKDVLIALPEMSEGKLHALVHALQPSCDSIYIVPQLWALPIMNLQVEGLLRERMMMLKLSNNLAKPWNRCLKRGLDLLVGSVISLLALPLCLILAVLIKLDSPGPALFVQERIGYRGGTFWCLKFRTMILDGEEKLAAHLAGNPQAADEWRRYAKLRNYDPRLTRLGRFLRRWSLDELPQLWNILKGEMSLVGPRPYIPQERERMGDQISTILSARPGLTGFWQVNGRNHVTLEDRVQLEAWYVRNWAVWLDCIVLAKTFKAVLFLNNWRRAGDRPARESAAQETAAEPLAYRHHA